MGEGTSYWKETKKIKKNRNLGFSKQRSFSVIKTDPYNSVAINTKILAHKNAERRL